MTRATRVCTLVPVTASLLLFAACASGKVPREPAVDPTRELVTVLQKQLLDLQAVQNETKRQVEEQTRAMSQLDSRLKALEEQRPAPPPPPSPALSKQAAPAAPKAAPKKQSVKKPVSKKKKKPVRREEP